MPRASQAAAQGGNAGPALGGNAVSRKWNPRRRRTAKEGLSDKQHALELLDQLGPGQLAAVVHLLEVMVQEEPEPVTEEDRRRFHEGQAWFAERGGKGIPMEDVLAEFGLKPEDFPLKK